MSVTLWQHLGIRDITLAEIQIRKYGNVNNNSRRAHYFHCKLKTWKYNIWGSLNNSWQKKWGTTNSEWGVSERRSVWTEVWTEASMLIFIFFVILCVNWQAIIFSLFHFQNLIYKMCTTYLFMMKTLLIIKLFLLLSGNCIVGKKKQTNMTFNKMWKEAFCWQRLGR